MNIFSRKYLIFILLILPLAVKASPFYIDVDDQNGYQGGYVRLALIDKFTDNFQAATLRISYDDAKLSFDPTKFSKVEPGKLIEDYLSSVVVEFSTRGIVDVSLATSTPTPNPIDQTTGSLLFVTFDILPNAVPGITDVSIECLNFDLPLTPCQASTTDYFVPATIGKVTILQKTTDVPEPEIVMLMLLGIFGYIGLTKNKKIRRL